MTIHKRTNGITKAMPQTHAVAIVVEFDNSMKIFDQTIPGGGSTDLFIVECGVTKDREEYLVILGSEKNLLSIENLIIRDLLPSDKE